MGETLFSILVCQTDSMPGSIACVTICALRPARHTHAGVPGGIAQGFELFEDFRAVIIRSHAAVSHATLIPDAHVDTVQAGRGFVKVLTQFLIANELEEKKSNSVAAC